MVAEIIFKDAIKFAYNKHATHVLIKFIKLVEVHPYLEKIYEVLAKNFAELSQDANGLPVVKTCIQKFNLPEIKHLMINSLSENVIVLSQNAYGNYAL